MIYNRSWNPSLTADIRIKKHQKPANHWFAGFFISGLHPIIHLCPKSWCVIRCVIISPKNDSPNLLKSDEFAKVTWVHFTTAYKHLKDFIKWKFQQNDLPITQVDFAFISDFEFYLKTVFVHTTQP